jgi:hypothetical protein
MPSKQPNFLKGDKVRVYWVLQGQDSAINGLEAEIMSITKDTQNGNMVILHCKVLTKDYPRYFIDLYSKQVVVFSRTIANRIISFIWHCRKC